MMRSTGPIRFFTSAVRNGKALRPHPAQLLPALLIAAVMLSACAAPTIAPQDQQTPQALWNEFRSVASQAKSFNLKASLNYAGPERKNRVVLHLHGNYTGPWRMDIEAGVGVMVAHILQSQDGFLAYIPDSRVAYYGSDPAQSVAVFKIGLPYTLKELALVLSGRWDTLTPEKYISAEAAATGGYYYTFHYADDRFTVLVGPDARAVEIIGPLPHPGATDETWTAEFSYLDEKDKTHIPKRIRMERPPKEKALLFLKDLERFKAVIPEEDLALKLPPDTMIRDTDKTVQ